MKVWVLTGQDVQGTEVYPEDDTSFLNGYEPEDWESYGDPIDTYIAGDDWVVAVLKEVPQ